MMAGILSKVGHILRETGQALDRLGCRLQGNNAFLEEGERARINETLVTDWMNVVYRWCSHPVRGNSCHIGARG